ncbi:DUF2971 domain-containing protein [Arthrobacter sp.]|uniref:DUF2971 domain-containing protein n=1 Tax=Arthrobacter sp. TaxID=1667 RepID=UPI003A8EB76D
MSEQKFRLSIDQLAGPRPDLVYHYTDAAGLLGIVHSHQLWASSAPVLNDKEELRYGIHVIQLAIDELETEQAIPLSSCQRWREITESDLFTSVVEDSFILSTSSDDDLLSQWRGYAGGTGFSLGLNNRNLFPLRNENGHRKTSFPSLTTPGWLPVVYEPSKQIEIAKSVLKRSSKTDMEVLWDTTVNQVPALSAGPEFTEHLERGMDIMRLQRLTACLKHPAFQDEREVRFVIVRTDSPQVRFRHSDNRIIPYALLHGGLAEDTHEKSGTLPIVSVKCGPGVRPETPQVVAEMLKNNGYDGVSISSSNIPVQD